jgi:hypothetical protein
MTTDCELPHRRTTNDEEASMAATTIPTWEASCRKAWAFHFIVCFVVMLAGILYNGNVVKLIPSRLRHEGCSKLFLNVLSPTNEGGTVCCSTTSDSFSLLCSDSFPPFYRQLTRLPDALIIPLVPILLRGVALAWQTLMTSRTSESWSTYLKRFNVYLAWIVFRGFVLFVGFNWVEGIIVGGPPAECWFSEYARRQPACQGIPFDFSDHTVLYFGQILAIPLTEILYAWLIPHGGIDAILSWLVSAGILYLYFITLLGEFRTAGYYHTAGEILVGYAISMILQLPLAYLQCYSSWARARTNLFGISTRSTNRQD